MVATFLVFIFVFAQSRFGKAVSVDDKVVKLAQLTVKCEEKVRNACRILFCFNLSVFNFIFVY